MSCVGDVTHKSVRLDWTNCNPIPGIQMIWMSNWQLLFHNVLVLISIPQLGERNLYERTRAGGQGQPYCLLYSFNQMSDMYSFLASPSILTKYCMDKKQDQNGSDKMCQVSISNNTHFSIYHRGRSSSPCQVNPTSPFSATYSVPKDH